MPGNHDREASSALPSFSKFFEAIWGYAPFPWQAILAERISAGPWPLALDLPTAAGKTACIDVAIYSLASQAERPLQGRSAPRRIWFVVDRRIVVDEAFERAQLIACALETPEDYLMERQRKHAVDLASDEINTASGILHNIADRLRSLSGTGRPLAVARLRGGIGRDDKWARLPSQPAVVTSTVDQLGSRLLFRSYDGSSRVSPIHAGLAANDSLILLDEAHCSVPFMQTLRSVEFYRSDRWSEQSLPIPFAFSILSATPPPEIPPELIFPGAERDIALASPILSRRLNVAKPAELRRLKAFRGGMRDPLVEEATALAARWIREDRKQRVAIIVNRVHVAAQIADQLQTQLEQDEADVVLLTGRFRPLERDAIVDQWKRFLKASSPEMPLKPIVLVSTQCIEVGANFSFDALVTECASLDALRQRFGRLNRMGTVNESLAAVLVREESLSSDAEDPIYGSALRETWSLLNEKASLEGDKEHLRRSMDFGFTTLDNMVSSLDDERLAACVAPRPDAPVLLPAHLDLLCQTAPQPCPEPDITAFLHGKNRGTPEAQVLWRCDLHSGDTDSWIETISLCPPISTETISVPIYRLRKWLSDTSSQEKSGDVEGEVKSDDDDVAGSALRPFLLWKGRDRSKVSRVPNAIYPGAVVVLPGDYHLVGLAHTTPDSEQKKGWGPTKADLWEWALDSANKPEALRIQRRVWTPWLNCAGIRELVTYAESSDWERERLWELVDEITEVNPSEEVETLPAWIIAKLKSFPRNARIETHPAGGLVLFERDHRRIANEPDLFEDDDDLTSLSGAPVSLSMHTTLVTRTAKNFSTRCLPAEFVTSFELAGQWHDVGKLDARFQLLLHQGDEVSAIASEPLAKSPNLAVSPSHRSAIRDASGLPKDFRHEMLSTQLAERFASLPNEAHWSNLVLHLIASHHGYGRPFAPVNLDNELPAIQGTLEAININLPALDRGGFIATHEIDSGIAERFWDSTRRYGWWGLAYLEAVLRLADWYGSSFQFDKKESHEKFEG